MPTLRWSLARSWRRPCSSTTRSLAAAPSKYWRAAPPPAAASTLLLLHTSARNHKAASTTEGSTYLSLSPSHSLPLLPPFATSPALLSLFVCNCPSYAPFSQTHSLHSHTHFLLVSIHYHSVIVLALSPRSCLTEQSGGDQRGRYPDAAVAHPSRRLAVSLATPQSTAPSTSAAVPEGEKRGESAAAFQPKSNDDFRKMLLGGK